MIPKLCRFLGMAPVPVDWKGIDELFPLLEKLRADGAVIMLKWDGEHGSGGDQGPYTALITGRVLSGEFFRADRASIEEALAEVIVAYASARWGFTPQTESKK